MYAKIIYTKLHTYLKMTEVAPFCAHFQSFNSSNTVGYLLKSFLGYGYFFGLYIHFCMELALKT